MFYFECDEIKEDWGKAKGKGQWAMGEEFRES
jgi:hypothetical protein